MARLFAMALPAAFLIGAGLAADRQQWWTFVGCLGALLWAAALAWVAGTATEERQE